MITRRNDYPKFTSAADKVKANMGFVDFSLDTAYSRYIEQKEWQNM